ncbi:MAG: indolepyruvate oxidoreductase subunit beta [Candidatus Margulisbacteria bacterium]|nr:indolepyruvate oxidoreductase subunit beta [Candidatus Margulisiibacteriota bacterium]
MNKPVNLLMVGVGGQGIILASDIIALAAIKAGYDAKKNEIHGMSQRGGSVFSHIRYGEKIYSPVIPEGQTDILVSLEEMETLRWLKYTNKKTKIIYFKNEILPANVQEYPKGIEQAINKSFPNVYIIKPEELKEKISSPKYLNTVLCGFLSNFLNLSKGQWIAAIKDKVPKETYELNLQAFETGTKLKT